MPFFCAVPPDAAAQPGRRAHVPGRRPVLRPGATVPARESSSGETATTAAIGHTTSTATTSTSPRTRRRGPRPDRGRQGRLGLRGDSRSISKPDRALLVKYGQNQKRFFLKPGLSMALLRAQLVTPALQGQPGAAASRESRDRPLRVHRRWGAAARPTSTCRRASRGTRIARSTRSRRRGAGEGAGGGHLRDGKAELYVPDCPGALACAQVMARQFGANRARCRAQDARRATPRPPPTSVGSATRTSPGTRPSSSGRPTSSIPSATSTGSSGRGTAAAPTWPASTRAPFQERMRAGRAPPRRGTRRRLPRPRPGALRAMPPRSCRSTSCNDATLVSARAGCLLLRPGLVLTTVCLKR